MSEDPRTTRDRQVAEFVHNLSQLDDGERARLKRNAGKPLAESRDAQLLFYSRVLPRGAPHWQEDHYFLLATLYPLDKTRRNRAPTPSDEAPQPAGSFGSFGSSFRRMRAADEKDQPGLDRRFARLLDAEVEDLPFQLRQAVTRLTNEWTPIDWAQLTHDILRWGNPERKVQRRWARDYVAYQPHDQQPQTN